MHTPDDALVALLDELVVLSHTSVHPRAVALLERLGTGDLRVALVGEAKRGKSTLGNALLGEEVLPAGVVPVTALSTEVRAGSPRRAEITFTDGSAYSTEVCELNRFVSERHNAHNHRHVRSVYVHLPEGMPHPRMVLVDTPGVGSVHKHNTEAAQEAFASMDAAVFVLTADPPISASELALLEQVAGLAVRVFVVLNKVDQLEPPELREATGFVTDVVTAALGTRSDLWVCSARGALRARVAGDEAGWEASGVPAFLEALLAYLTTNRERDLRVSIATAAARLAARELDRVIVTLAALEAYQAEQEHRVRELAGRLDVVDHRRDEAVGFVTTGLTGERSKLDVDAAQEVTRLSARVRNRLEAFLSTAQPLGAAELEQRGRAVIAETTRAGVEAWRTRWHNRLRDAVGELVEREQGLVEEAVGELSAALRDLLGVRLQSELPVLAAPAPPILRYDFVPDPGWNQALVSGLRTHAPAGIGRRRVIHYLRADEDRLVDKHVGRARADVQAQLEQTGRWLRAEVFDAFTDLTVGLRTGYESAVAMRGSAEAAGHRDELPTLHQQRAGFEELTRRLHVVGEEPNAIVSHPDDDHVAAPTGTVRPATTKEETR